MGEEVPHSQPELVCISHGGFNAHTHSNYSLSRLFLLFRYNHWARRFLWLTVSGAADDLPDRGQLVGRHGRQPEPLQFVPPLRVAQVAHFLLQSAA